jgi:hypothetical protein
MPAPQKPSTTPSLPGKLAKRTDGGPASKQAVRYASGMPNYGDGQDFLDIQSSAPMKKATTPTFNAGTFRAAEQASMANVTPLGAPSQDTLPVTHGADSGDGPGLASLGLPPAQTDAEKVGFENALSLLNQLGNDVTPQVKAIRQALAAHLNNQAGGI